MNESLRRERRLHSDVFERDERIQQMSLTMSDLESALQDHENELEDIRESMSNELDSVAEEREPEKLLVGYSDSLSL